MTLRPRPTAPVTVLTGRYAAPWIARLASGVRPDVDVVAVDNRFFGGNIAVAGLLTGDDVGRTLADLPLGRRYLLPDVCLSGGRFLDGMGLEDLPQAVEVVPADGASLRAALAAGA